MSRAPLPAARIVKPRQPRHSLLHVIAISRQEILLERTGDVLPISELPAVVVAEPSSMIVAEGMGRFILALAERFKDSDEFQYKLTPVYRDLHPTNGEVKRRSVLRDTTTSLVGFSGNYHHPVDPVSFIRFGIDEIDRRHLPQITKLFDWGIEVRNFCLNNDMRLKPSAGGLAAQLLQDPRFYPRARRKVPKMLNTKGRDKLPGNYYNLYAERQVKHSASYLDMENSHHAIAQRVEFPSANELRGYGRFRSDKSKPWASPGSKRLEKALKCYGLFHARIQTPHLPPDSFAPPYMLEQGERDAWIFSNEIPLIHALGGRIDCVYSAIISPDKDTGLSKYAEYAVEELQKNPGQKAWMKPVLHSVYGVLAARPRPLEFGWRNAKGGDSDVYPMGGKVVPVKVVKTDYDIEARVVNTIHRGMIEAEQRSMSLTLARELHAQGGKILCVYADSLFVTMPQLPLLPWPWRLKEQVTNLRFLSATQFVSPEITRLPGVARRSPRFGPSQSAARRASMVKFRPTGPLD